MMLALRPICVIIVVLSFCFAYGGGEDLPVDDPPDGSSKTSVQLLALGDEEFTNSNIQSAVNFYEQGIQSLDASVPLSTAIELYSNLGSALSYLDDNQSAIGAYRRAILLHSENIESLGDDEDKKRDATNFAAKAAYYLGMVLQETKNFEKSADAYSLAATLDPLLWSSVANLGVVLQDNMNMPADALAAFNKAYELLTQKDVQPTDPPEDLRAVLSHLQYRTGLAIRNGMSGRRCAIQDDPSKSVPCEEMATHAFSMAVKFDETNEKAKHMLAAMTADATMSRASTKYVTELFDEYASNFEHSLVDELKYDGFERLRRGFDEAFGQSKDVPSFDIVIDAGCGTGLAGEQFRNISKTLIGVDLSPSIIEEAKTSRPGLYEELVVGDVVDLFRKRKPIDLIVASDSFIYFGDLSPVFAAMNEGLKDGGFVALSLENASEESEKSLNDAKPDWRWQLTPSGRFAHRKRYVESLALEYSLDIVRYSTFDNFREEKGEGVRGHMFVLRKLSSSADTEL